MYSSHSSSNLPTVTSSKQVAHIVVAGLKSSNKRKLIWQISETPLETVDIASNQIPTKLPNLILGKLNVDSRLIAHIWGAPDHWQHDYVNYLVNIRSILNRQGDNHRVMGMLIVVDSRSTTASDEEAKLLRLVASDWKLPYIVLASHPYKKHARSLSHLREAYDIDTDIPLFQCDVTNPDDANRAFINLIYHAM